MSFNDKSQLLQLVSDVNAREAVNCNLLSYDLVFFTFLLSLIVDMSSKPEPLIFFCRLP